jgi:hypothetical protein
VQCVILTDGEANSMPYHVLVKDYFNSDEYKMGVRGINPNHCSLRDRSLGKVYRFGYSWWQFTDALIKNLQDKFPSTNFIGIRVLPVREGSNIIRRYCVKDGATKGQIKTAFVKSLKTKKLNKKVLGEFVSLVA